MSERTEPTSLIKTNQLQLHREIITLYCDYQVKQMAQYACNMHNSWMLEQVVHIAAIAL